MTVRNAETMGDFGSSWQHKGYSGSGNVAGLLNSLQGRTAIVCGSAEGVFSELDHALMMTTDPVIFAANDIGMFLPKLDHWVSLHPNKLGLWKQVRWANEMPREVAKYHSIDPRPSVDYVWTGLTPLFCISGYFAMQIAWVMGCERIILCGCPGTQKRRFFDLYARTDFGYGNGPGGGDQSVMEQVVKEMQKLPDFKAAVRSTSGWTQDFFGGI